MARALAEIQEEIRALSSAEREELLRTLLEDLDGPADPDVERAWIEEAQRRSRELDEGKVEAVPAKKVFERVTARLKK